MTVFNDRIGYVHVPKTAGTWAQQALQTVVPDLRESDERMGHLRWDELPSEFKFGFVRDPADWYASYWSHRKFYGDYDEHVMDPHIEASTDFSHFVELATRHVPGVLSYHYELFLGPPGAVDFVGHYESLVDDFVTALVLAEELPPDFELADYHEIRSGPVNNRQQPRGVTMTQELREMIYAAESEAVARFGY
jgi:hypothetical protein